MKNNKPEVIFVGSPNYNERPAGVDLSAIVMHATVSGNIEGVIAWFNNPEAQASAHYTIDKNGYTVQHVSDYHRAWHAGESSWQGRPALNDWSLGIELVNWNSGTDPYPEEQYQAAINLVSWACEYYGIDVNKYILAHYDVSPDRKTDPLGFDMTKLCQSTIKNL